MVPARTCRGYNCYVSDLVYNVSEVVSLAFVISGGSRRLFGENTASGNVTIFRAHRDTEMLHKFLVFP